MLLVVFAQELVVALVQSAPNPHIGFKDLHQQTLVPVYQLLIQVYHSQLMELYEHILIPAHLQPLFLANSIALLVQVVPLAALHAD
jgi:hypothetical protein